MVAPFWGAVLVSGNLIYSKEFDDTWGEGRFLNAPLICWNAEIAGSLLATRAIQELVVPAGQPRVALPAVGSLGARSSHFTLTVSTGTRSSASDASSPILPVSWRWYP